MNIRRFSCNLCSSTNKTAVFFFWHVYRRVLDVDKPTFSRNETISGDRFATTMQSLFFHARLNFWEGGNLLDSTNSGKSCRIFFSTRRNIFSKKIGQILEFRK